VHGDAAAFAVEEQLHPGESPLQLPDPGDGADGVQVFRRHLLEVLPLGHGEDQLVRRGERRLDRAEGSGAAGANRSGHAREEHDFAQGQHWEIQTIGHRIASQSLRRGRKWQQYRMTPLDNAPAVPSGLAGIYRGN
jgi:hypothetical protein